MTDTKVSRVRLADRTPLQNVIPLKTPYVLQIEPTNLCNLSCRFCPMGDNVTLKERGVPLGYMPLALFEKLVADLTAFDEKIKTVHLYGNGEPFLHKQFASMVKMIKKSAKVDIVDTTTNGLLLDHARVDELIGSGIDRINVSINGINSEQYYHVTRRNIDFEELVSNLAYLYESRGGCEILIKSIAELYADDQAKNRFFEIFSPIADLVTLENLTDPWPYYSVEENLGIKSTKAAFFDVIEDKQVCSPIFYSLFINFDGSVSLCCVDWRNELIVGDLHKASLKEIWQSETLLNYQIKQLNGERKNNPVCRDCRQLSQCVFDNIDPYMEQLKHKILAGL